jgi:hypothetical protein
LPQAGGFETYLPRLRERRVVQGRKVEVRPPRRLLLRDDPASGPRRVGRRRARRSDGLQPARVADRIIDEIRARVRGLVELPEAEKFKPGTPVRVLRGPLEGKLGVIADMRPRDRVLILLTLLGGQRQVELARQNIEVMRK